MDGPWFAVILVVVVLGAVIAPVMTLRYLARTGKGSRPDSKQDEER